MHIFTEGTKAESEKVNENFEEAKKGGGVVDLELAEALSAGDVAYLNSSGNLKKALGPVDIDETESSNSDILYDIARIDQNTYFLLMRSYGSSNIIKGIIATVDSSKNVTFGASRTLHTAGSYNFYDGSCDYSLTDDRVVCMLKTNDTNNKVKAVVCYVSGTSITTSSIIDVSNASSEIIYSLSLRYNPDENAFFFCWTDDNQSSATIRIRGGSIDLDGSDPADDSLTFGTEIGISTNASYENRYIRTCYNTGDDVMHLIYFEKRSGSSTYFKDVTISMSGVTVTNAGAGTVTSVYGVGNVSNGDDTDFDICYNPDDDKVMLVYVNYEESSGFWYAVQYLRGDVSGSGISWENSSNFVDLTTATTANGKIRIAWDSSTETYAIAYEEYSSRDLSITRAIWDTTNFAGEIETIENENYNYGCAIFGGDNGVVYFYRSYISSAYKIVGAGFLYAENRKDNLLFIMQEAGSIGETKKALAIESGGVSDIHTGLTVGAEQFVGADGELTETDNGFLVGIAISASKVYTPGRQLKYQEIDPVESTFSASSSWQSWNLKSEAAIKAGAKFLEVNVKTIDSCGIGVRKYGSSVSRSVSSESYSSATFTVSVEAENMIEIYNNNYSSVKFRVLGYWY